MTMNPSSVCYCLSKILLTYVHMFHMTVCTAALTTEASAKVIDGKAVAKQIRDEITSEVSRMKEAIGVIPGLAVILVGDRKDSATYVRNKKKACESVGINSLEVHLPEDSTEEEVLNYISGYNDDPSVHGILVQLPLPSVRFYISNFVLFLGQSMLNYVISLFLYLKSELFLSSYGTTSSFSGMKD